MAKEWWKETAKEVFSEILRTGKEYSAMERREQSLPGQGLVSGQRAWAQMSIDRWQVVISSEAIFSSDLGSPGVVIIGVIVSSKY